MEWLRKTPEMVFAPTRLGVEPRTFSIYGVGVPGESRASSQYRSATLGLRCCPNSAYPALPCLCPPLPMQSMFIIKLIMVETFLLPHHHFTFPYGP
ncbi:hypothetical protein VTJ04DRAFT_9873 [Mycothermus thermophilus]|uniref:uncharacterized protein n=1 Tax=Humicola insolens TaxID=85995 RepID=UPI003743CE8F